MSRFRKVDPRFWKDEKIIPLPPMEKLIALYLFTGQSNRIGLFSFSPGEAAEDLSLSLETFREGFGNVCQTLNFGWDETFRVLYLPTWWKYNVPENANNVIGNLKDLNDVPDSPLIEWFINNLQYLSEELQETFTQTLAKRYPQGYPKRSPSQEQEQEQEQEKERMRDEPSPDPFSPHKFSELYESCASNLPQPREVTKERLKKIRQRLKTHPTREFWQDVFTKANQSPFLKGESDGGWKASLDWFVKNDENAVKVLEGKYDKGVQERPAGPKYRDFDAERRAQDGS